MKKKCSCPNPPSSSFQFGAFYENWQIFWSSQGNSPCCASTLTPQVPIQVPQAWTSIAPMFDSITYGFGMFGVQVNTSEPYYTLTGDYSVPSTPSGEGGMMYPKSAFSWMSNTSDDVVFSQLKTLRTNNPGLKLLVAFGGWNWCTNIPASGNTTGLPDTRALFHEMVQTSETRMEFIQTVYSTFIAGYGFDGIEIDWEYPGNTMYCSSQDNTDFYGLESLIREFKAYAAGQTQGAGANTIVSVYTAPYLSPGINYSSIPGYPSSWTMQTDSDYYQWVANLAAATSASGKTGPGADLIKVMFYDYNVAGSDGATGPNAPLTNPVSSGSTPPVTEYIQNNLAGYIAAFTTAGVPLTKIHGGLAYYGRSYQNVSSIVGQGSYAANNFGLTTDGAAPGGFYTGECNAAGSQGVLSYQELAYLLNVPPADNNTCCTGAGCPSACTWSDQAFAWPSLATVDNTASSTPIAYTGTGSGYWVSYDDAASITAKVQYFEQQGIGGVFAFGPANDEIIDYSQTPPAQNVYTLTNATYQAIGSGETRLKKKKARINALKKGTRRPK